MPGQHFLTHVDAFPSSVVAQKGYQRKATLLCYLNDVPEGGGTLFDLIDLRIKPVKGTALLFFPGFVTGMPDQRMPHTAEDAVYEKWVSQLWVVEGTKLPVAQGRGEIGKGSGGGGAKTLASGSNRGGKQGVKPKPKKGKRK